MNRGYHIGVAVFKTGIPNLDELLGGGIVAWSFHAVIEGVRVAEDADAFQLGLRLAGTLAIVLVLAAYWPPAAVRKRLARRGVRPGIAPSATIPLAPPTSEASMSDKTSRYSDAAHEFIGKEIEHLKEDRHMEQSQAVAVAMSQARKKGYKVPKEKKD